MIIYNRTKEAGPGITDRVRLRQPLRLRIKVRTGQEEWERGTAGTCSNAVSGHSPAAGHKGMLCRCCWSASCAKPHPLPTYLPVQGGCLQGVLDAYLMAATVHGCTPVSMNHQLLVALHARCSCRTQPWTGWVTWRRRCEGSWLLPGAWWPSRGMGWCWGSSQTRAWT
jgi:hypothetical protein